MAIYVLACVYDRKVGAHNAPMMFRSKGEAIRSFSDAVGDKNSAFCKHPEDYTLVQVGHFDDETGLVVEQKESIITALECQNFRDPAGDVSGVS